MIPRWKAYGTHIPTVNI